MTHMGKENEIATLLRHGKLPIEIIKMGYKKATVYKVARNLDTKYPELVKRLSREIAAVGKQLGKIGDIIERLERYENHTHQR